MPVAHLQTPGQKRRRGFTLAEVLIALMLVVVGLTSLSLFFGTVTRGAAFTDHVAAADQLAQAKIEQLLAATYNTMTSGNDQSGVFRRAWTVTRGSGLSTILVRVTWTELGAGTRSVSLRSVRAR